MLEGVPDNWKIENFVDNDSFIRIGLRRESSDGLVDYLLWKFVKVSELSY